MELRAAHVNLDDAWRDEPLGLPALDAHTRLLLGRSLAYQVTEKVPRQAIISRSGRSPGEAKVVSLKSPASS